VGELFNYDSNKGGYVVGSITNGSDVSAMR
jgi:hypothetical protein